MVKEVQALQNLNNDLLQFFLREFDFLVDKACQGDTIGVVGVQNLAASWMGNHNFIGTDVRVLNVDKI